MISLFPHNKAAYHAAVEMMVETGKAAVVHPTGTGKSFIAFKLCQEHPNACVCWISPSEYIFQTQVENLKAVTNGYAPRNIQFFTYAKLMNLVQEELSWLRPDYIILDEFHRAGAQQWQYGVQRLLELYPDVPLLGLSATNIRYLDHQRDMADELFDGNIASEMTLGEAIVRGILHPPKYVLSLFSYQKDLEKFQRRVRLTKSKVVRDTAEQYLEAMRRALDQADGLDVVFDRHMTDRTGKYIVFCANYQHLCEMRTHTEWFTKVDASPRIYTVYTEDPSASESFQAFKEDKKADHLRLLFAIDVLNEGIHLDDIAGVILLRPTISPIIYKQQIGRALAAGTKQIPVIFDIVNNIENLYSVDSLEREMQEAVLYFRTEGDGSEIVNERFRVLDEVRDCRELFDKLHDTLSASWDLMYRQAKEFYGLHGHLDVPKRYKTPEGYSLGNWIMTQRRIYTGKISGILTENQVQKLNAIGMCWDARAEITWKQGYAELCKYKEEHGDLEVPSCYVTEKGVALGKLVTNIRTAKTCGTRSVFLTEEHAAALTELGFVWDKLDYAWERYYLACMKFKVDQGHMNIPVNAVSEEGLAIGSWARRMRQIRAGQTPGRLTEDQIRRLDALGFSWENHFARQWNEAYERLAVYQKKNGHVRVPVAYVDKTGFALGKWVSRQKSSSDLSPEKKEKLMALGMIFGKTDPWELRYSLAKRFYEEHGHLKIPANYTAEGVNLNKWLSEQRQIRLGNRTGKSLTQDQIARLNAIGMRWDGTKDRKKSGKEYVAVSASQ